MRNVIKYYAIVWAVIVGLFNAIVFITHSNTIGNDYTTTFWFGYALAMVGFAGQLGCACVSFGGKNAQKAFYRMSLIRMSFIGTILSFIVGLIFMMIPMVEWVCGLICLIVLAINIVLVMTSVTASGIVSELDKEVKTKTYFIRTLTVDAESLLARAQGAEAYAECKKVYEAARYSDPMSHERLEACEQQIYAKFTELTQAVIGNNIIATKRLAAETVDLIEVRNRHCKFLK